MHAPPSRDLPFPPNLVVCVTALVDALRADGPYHPLIGVPDALATLRASELVVFLDGAVQRAHVAPSTDLRAFAIDLGGRVLLFHGHRGGERWSLGTEGSPYATYAPLRAETLRGQDQQEALRHLADHAMQAIADLPDHREKLDRMAVEIGGDEHVGRAATRFHQAARRALDACDGAEIEAVARRSREVRGRTLSAP